MMPNVTRGGNARGLMVYLMGPGRANEHTDQHIIAGTVDIAGPDFFGGRQLSHQEALRAGVRLDLNRLEHGTKVLGNRTHWDYDLEKIVSTGKGPAHVWHCSLTLHPDEGELSDETWARIATDFVTKMGMTETADHAGCRWVAVRHGLNDGGCDHIHIAVVLVRDDGRIPDVWNDYSKAQKACNMLEHKYGLDVLESREHQRGARGETPAEQAKAARDGHNLTERARLELIMRAVAAASTTESEFVTKLRAQGVLLRPRYARGTRDHVEGFSVALKPDSDEAKPVWFGAGRVARDLSLRRLRAGWLDMATERRKALEAWRPSTPWNSPEGREQRARLEAIVRTAAADSATESEFVTKLRDQGILVSAHRDRQGNVDRFSVAIKPDSDEAKPIWFRSGYIARDLALERLRQHWSDTPTERRKALEVWVPARNKPWVSHEEWRQRQISMWRAMAQAVDESLERFDTVTFGDDEGLSQCAHEAAGTFSALSQAWDGNHPFSFALAAAARRMGGVAQRKPPPARRPPSTSPARAALARACLAGPARRNDERVWQAAVRLASGLAATLERHDQPVTARRLRTDIRALTDGQPAQPPSTVALGQHLLDATFGPAAPGARPHPTPPTPPRRPPRPRGPHRGPTR